MDEVIFMWGFGIIILLLDLWAMASVWQTTKSLGTKIGWAVLIFCLPIIGVAIWGIAGPRGVAEPPTSPDHSKG
jgi:hypothetical protein